MGAHSNFLSEYGDAVTTFAAVACIVIFGLIIAIIDKHKRIVKQRRDKQAEQRKRAIARKKMDHERAIDNFFRDRVEESLSEITSNPYKLDKTAQNLVDAYRS